MLCGYGGSRLKERLSTHLNEGHSELSGSCQCPTHCSLEDREDGPPYMHEDFFVWWHCYQTQHVGVRLSALLE